MPRTIYTLDRVDRITVGAVGVPGHRTFYIQAQKGAAMITLLCEKEQVQAIAMGIGEILEQIEEKYPHRPAGDPVPAADLELQEPLEPAFRVGQLALGYDEERNAMVLVAYQMAESEETDPDTLAIARFWATRTQMQALADHAQEVVARGRPICEFCGGPIDPEGHICPKRNGHKLADLS